MRFSVYCVSDMWSLLVFCLFFFKQKTAYEMRISDWSSDVCSSDLLVAALPDALQGVGGILHLVHEDDVRLLSGDRPTDARATVEIGRASCRERVCQYV